MIRADCVDHFTDHMEGMTSMGDKGPGSRSTGKKPKSGTKAAEKAAKKK
jgi:hypothetical protein